MTPAIVEICFDYDEGKWFPVFCLDNNLPLGDPLTLIYSEGYDPYDVNQEGIIAIGGEINYQRLVESYSYGVFPWFAFRDEEPAVWYCPRHRYVIFPEKIHISHSLRNTINKCIYKVTFDIDFENVIKNCSRCKGRYEDSRAWLGDTIVETFIRLHESNHAHSVEVWEGDKLVGGLYGFVRNGVFQGESMFSLKKDAGKIALVKLAEKMKTGNGKFIDCQFKTDFFESMGGEFIEYKKYREIMDLK